MPRRSDDTQPPNARNSGRPFDFGEIQLHPRHEQRHGHANREHRCHEPIELNQIQDVGANHDPKHDFENHDRHLKARWDLGQQWRKDGGRKYPEYGVAD
jgi:hypothetical protein